MLKIQANLKATAQWAKVEVVKVQLALVHLPVSSNN
jgi:hypothetical protein